MIEEISIQHSGTTEQSTNDGEENIDASERTALLANPINDEGRYLMLNND